VYGTFQEETNPLKENKNKRNRKRTKYDTMSEGRGLRHGKMRFCISRGE
jgi:hypothetical protein